MQVHIWTFGPHDMGALGDAARVDQTIELVTSDDPLIEITLDNGARVQLKPIKSNRIEVTYNGFTSGGWRGRMALSPSAANQFEIIFPD